MVRDSANEKRNIAILGSTGSIGTQALDVIAHNQDRFVVEVLSAHSNTALLIKQAITYKPNAVVITEESKYDEVSDALQNEDIKVYAGHAALEQVVQMENIDMVLTAIVGFAGLRSTLSAINAGKSIALANKETLVVAGDIITRQAREKGVNIYPVDSEHSAIFQCMVGEWENPIECIYLTASGGPFRGMNQEQLEKVTLAQALKHPNWDMGTKITIDSATMMNKGLEVIEAKWLFGLVPDQIKVIVHPQSIIHSIVQFCDGSMKAQMGLPDMRLPIQYALGYPERLVSEHKRFNFADYPALTFEQPDFEAFKNLKLAYEALEKGGIAPCVLNAANEVAVDAFLQEKIKFVNIPTIIERCLEQMVFINEPTLNDYEETDGMTRIHAKEMFV
jgi:1-deoxy-D-xylulose-5-phosphate reductoisomerase